MWIEVHIFLSFSGYGDFNMGKYNTKLQLWIAFFCVLLSLHYVVSDIPLWDFVSQTDFTLLYLVL